MIIIFKIIIDLICGALNALGGWKIIQLRRFVMPLFIALGISISTGIWWLGLTSIPVMGTLCLGYFGKEFLGRGSWLALQAFVIGLGSFIFGHLAWYLYIPYIAISFLLGGFLYDIEQIDGDSIFGIWLGTIIFLVR